MRSFSKLSLFEVKIGQEDLFEYAVVVSLCKVDHFYIIGCPLLFLFHIKLYLYQVRTLACVYGVYLADPILLKSHLYNG